MHERGILIRIWFIALLLLVSFCGLGAKLCYLHLSNHSKVTGREYKRTLLGLRGGIYDCNGKQYPMAVSLPARLFYLDPKSVKKEHDVGQIARTVSQHLGLPEAEVQAQFRRTDSRYIKLGYSLDDRVFEALSDPLTISGVGAEEMVIRRYPQGRRMSHVLGFVNNMGVGGAGIEQQYNRYLTGTPGLIEGEKDAGRREIFSRRKVYVPPIAGSDIYLTLDHRIQFEVERAIQEVVEKFDALSGWAIVQHVRTGKILAMASFPDFEPENYTETTLDVWRNNALAIVYEPGSIMKAVTVAAMLNERLATPTTEFEVGEGVWFYAGKPLRDHVYGRVTVSTALKKSSNIACAKMGLRLGAQRLENYLRAFNFGSKLGIELPGEENGILARAKDWDKLKPTRIPIGQGIAVTGLQMINAYSTLANDGRMMRPYLVDRIVSPSGETVFQARPEVIGRPVRPDVARAVREMLTGVTEEGGTGKRAAVPGFSIGGKTGTAQKAVPGGYSSTDYYASFVGFVPAGEPVFSVLVSVERPRPQHTGGFVSAPVFGKIAAATARYLALDPDLPSDEEDGLDAAQP
ncbi:MAG TPA: penicillin-binding protein 2 [Kiritimatiellia bacterium]|jgi:cell division protein FtsI (penicillin-binding protein 3)|nr:MAG: Penicillin-binding protein 2B [Verrucomicrobia bacterium ADurb.Bin070]HPB10855.1 penicillin-binding protein 2 [Kiritimatiellia bacterium]HPO36658.1 penicillin-binding protein 2 [Kiritimatiellia bacterium]HQA37488.1 penicillin-binding protein 2 [Kiritimatiellia bacterium]HQQ91113.1 penicillin-binding protein 2 [Kiritimatiellia bacterium]